MLGNNMMPLLVVMTVLVFLFGFSLSWFLVKYQMKVQDSMVRFLSVTVLGSLVTVTTFVLLFTLIWP